MAFKICFMVDRTETNEQGAIAPMQKAVTVPKKSVVQVRFPGRGTALAYYNDQFDLHEGDLVYVDGKLEGIQGRVVDVSYNFKIKVSEYKKVIAVVDTQVKGELFMAGSHFVTFDANVLPYSKVLSWFKAPDKEDEEYASGNDDSAFPLSNLNQLKVSAAIAERGQNYYLENKVRYLCINGTQGKAIVEGTETYEVEFCYQDGQMSNLICDCFCTYHCKHEVAAMLHLRETLELIEKHYPDRIAESGYFAAIYKPTVFLYAIDSKETGSIVL